jgi:lipoyl-dependent peroxiredoxin
MITKILYTSEATAHGGRGGHVRTPDGRLDLPLDVPVEMGGPGGPGTNPEQLGFGLSVALDLEAPGLDRAQAATLMERAHELCPYSRATRSNIDVVLSVGGTRIERAAA